MAQLEYATFAAGDNRVEWDGLSEKGERLPSGIYFIRVAGKGVEAVLRAALVR
ncbi:FlgD immunoglobulin-like domain containing protein [Hyphomicrobium sp.]|uniref:FlgD immunoglobulin-like domain containing protein n=1 Tax=Hyphomicrobium sp. TaxID=82 RepID=UPI003419092D